MLPLRASFGLTAALLSITFLNITEKIAHCFELRTPRIEQGNANAETTAAGVQLFLVFGFPNRILNIVQPAMKTRK